MTEVRLQKIISAAGVCSRRNAERLITQERVRVNNKVAFIGDKANPEIDTISLDGSPISQKIFHKVILINKPIGVISSCKDQHGRVTVTSLIPEELRQGLHTIGRLDLESRGVMLLTNNGKLTLHLSHPRYSHAKTYEVLVKGVPSSVSLKRWNSGLMLDGKLTRKAKVDLVKSSSTSSLLRIVLREGRNRQIRRIAELIGHPVIDLRRTAIAGLKLNNLQEGEWRLVKRSEWLPLLNE